MGQLDILAAESVAAERAAALTRDLEHAAARRAAADAAGRHANVHRLLIRLHPDDRDSAAA